MTDQIIDEAALAELRSIMGDDFQLLVDTFVNDSEQRIVALQEAVDTADAELLRTSAHSFKGSSLNISAGRLTALCKDLEDRGRESRLDGAAEVLAGVRVAFDDIKAYFAA
ncbi:MAG: Hpt domain-containing protein [Pseudomonadales bacterium]|nr:Hpt domain-containing protein [Pseudomonadales bacterium]